MLDQAAPGGLIKYNPPLRRGSASTACKTSNIFHENRLNGWAHIWPQCQKSDTMSIVKR